MDSTPIIFNPGQVEEELTRLFQRQPHVDAVTRRSLVFASVGLVAGLGYSLFYAAVSGDWTLPPVASTCFVFTLTAGVLGLPPSMARRRVLVAAFAVVGLLLGLTLGSLVS